jgi:peptidoglycan/xylan/chitin deacetylase (PgdA/CDA1 family)
MIIKKILSLVASIISLLILQLLFTINSNSEENNSKYYSSDSGILSLMYHRFNENKYPSTNIQMDVFKKHIETIKNTGYKFYDPKSFISEFNLPKNEKKILLTIDDGFKSFYEEAWPYLKENKIPFILFVSTEPVGKFGYMNWNEIKKIKKYKGGYIGHNSHTHEYLIDMSEEEFMNDIETATKIFKEKLGYSPPFFSYPFGEYSNFIKDFISKNFDFAFGQHSGVIDINKDPHELPRFPINEKYGDLERFKFLINLSPLQYKSLNPEDKYIDDNNPPKLSVEFFENQKNIEDINCFSVEGSGWDRSNITFTKTILNINFREKFTF